jgi:hypothetical protein
VILVYICLDSEQSRERLAWEDMIFHRLGKRDATSIAASM